MRTLQGWYLEAKRYTDLGSVPRTQDPDTVNGAILMRYDLFTKKKHEYKNGIVIDVDKTWIETDLKVDVKKDDRVYIKGGWRKVIEVDVTIPEDKKSILKLWPNRYNSLAIKKVYVE